MAPTIQRPSDQGFAQMAGARMSAFLSGHYTFRFSNEAKRTVKLHLTDDRPDRKSQDYFLTLPVGSKGVEVPMKFDMIAVTAGFYNHDSRSYEVFWQSRRFGWESGIEICVAQRHSVDANKIREDVYPGAPEVRQCSHGKTTSSTILMLSSEAHSNMTMPSAVVGSGHCSVSLSSGALNVGQGGELDNIRVYTRTGARDWTASDISCARPDGSIEVCDDQGTVRRVWPEKEPSLLELPPSMPAFTWASRRSFASEVSMMSAMLAPPADMRHPQDKLRGAIYDGSPRNRCSTMSTNAPTIASQMNCKDSRDEPSGPAVTANSDVSVDSTIPPQRMTIAPHRTPEFGPPGRGASALAGGREFSTISEESSGASASSSLPSQDFGLTGRGPSASRGFLS